MDEFHKVRRPTYRKNAKEYMAHGVPVKTSAGTFMYDVKLEWQAFLQSEDLKRDFATLLLSSLQEVKKQKKIIDFNFDEFYRDFEALFKEVRWI